MYTRKIKLVSFALIIAISAIGIVSGYNASEDSKTKVAAENCNHENSEDSAAAAQCAKAEAKQSENKSQSCCKIAEAKACSNKAETKCTKSSSSTKT
jgi:cytochrome bd-type quinol oxidase subunit 1